MKRDALHKQNEEVVAAPSQRNGIAKKRRRRKNTFVMRLPGSGAHFVKLSPIRFLGRYMYLRLSFQLDYFSGPWFLYARLLFVDIFFPQLYYIFVLLRLFLVLFVEYVKTALKLYWCLIPYLQCNLPKSHVLYIIFPILCTQCLLFHVLYFSPH